MYIVVAIIAFGLLIAVHELGHFLAAKSLGVRVSEFAIGMGPKILKKQGRETLYTLRMLPFGGFCAMDEDEEAVDDKSFTAQKRWRRVIILAAGAAANFIVGFLIIIILSAQINTFVGTTVTGFIDGFPLEGEQGLMAGDSIVSINGERLYYADDFLLFMTLADSGEVDLVVRRDGETIIRSGLPLERREYVINGGMELKYGINFNSIEGSFGESLKYSCYTAMNNVRLIRVSLVMLFTGQAGLADISGPVGMVSMMNDIGQSAEESGASVWAALGSLLNFTAFIMINLAVMNMLPIPALDGGRIVGLFITWIIEKIIRRRLDPKYEGYIHTGALVLLMGLMALVLVSDVFKIFNG